MSSQYHKSLTCGETELLIQITRFEGKLLPLFFKPHDNEQTAASAVNAALAQQGGVFVEILNNQERNITFCLEGRSYTFDPNRIYSPEGIRKTLRNRSAYTKVAQTAVASFAAQVLPLLEMSPNRYMLTAHNNTEGWFSILSYKNKPYTLRYHRNPKRCIDDFFIVTTQQAFDFFASQQFNVAWENPSLMSDDGSLSAYAFRNNIPYINVEAMHGHSDEHLEMIEATLKFNDLIF